MAWNASKVTSSFFIKVTVVLVQIVNSPYQTKLYALFPFERKPMLSFLKFIFDKSKNDLIIIKLKK